MNLPIKRLHPRAFMPTRAHSTDAGLDLYALDNVPLRSGEVAKVRTGIALAIPAGHVGIIKGRSSLAALTPEVVEVDALPETARGAKGFGSSGT